MEKIWYALTLAIYEIVCYRIESFAILALVRETDMCGQIDVDNQTETDAQRIRCLLRRYRQMWHLGNF